MIDKNNSVLYVLKRLGIGEGVLHTEASKFKKALNPNPTIAKMRNLRNHLVQG